MLRRQERDRKWRANYKSLERKLVILEEDEYQLERIYPQVRAGEVVACVGGGGMGEGEG